MAFRRGRAGRRPPRMRKGFKRRRSFKSGKRRVGGLRIGYRL